MREVSKFKFFNKKHNYPYFFYNRILSFKRPKWKVIKKKMLLLKRIRRVLAKKVLLKKKIALFQNLLFFKNNLKQKVLYSKAFFSFFKTFKKVLIQKKVSFLKLKLKKFLRKKQKRITKKQVKLILNNFFFNFIRIKSKISSWTRLRFNFKETLWMKFSVFKYFNFCFSTSFFKRLLKKNKSRVYNTSLAFIKAEYRLDILLWRLKFFISPYMARIAVRHSLISIESKFINKKISPSYFVMFEDVIKIKKVDFNFKKSLAYFAKSIYLPTYLEVDYYTNMIIILKNVNHLKAEDINSIIKEPLCFNKFKNFVLR